MPSTNPMSSKWGISPVVDSLRIGGIDREFTWSASSNGRMFEVMLPRRLEPADTGVVVELVFSATVLRVVGNLFAGRVFDTSRPQEVRQRIFPGNAVPEIDSDRLSVTTALSNSLDRPVAPGLYLYQITADVHDRETGTGILSVAY